MIPKIKSISISGYKGIQELTLKDIKGLNILCGKNNSGKSTILSSIQKRNNDPFITITLEVITIEFILNQISYHEENNKFAGPEKIGNETVSKEALQYLKEHLFVFLEKDKWFISDLNAQHLAIKFDKFINSNHNSSFHSDLSLEYDTFFLSFFRDFKTHFIDSKRQFSFKEKFFELKELTINNDSFLNLLFQLKNKPNNSLENNKFRHIERIFDDISFGYKFDISIYEKDLILSFSRDSNDWHKADDCGQGLSEILYMVSNILLSDANIFLIEEPENHLHPDIQRNLLTFFRSMTINNKIFFIATHSNIFLDLSIIDKIFHVQFDDQIRVNDSTKKAEILHDIGYSVSDNLAADLIILVEGPSDKPVIEELMKKMDFQKKFDIKIWALGGDIMDKQDLSIFSQSHKTVAIVDKDPKSSKIRNKFIRKCTELDIDCIKLDRYSIENYFTIRALKEIFKSSIVDTITQIDPSKRLEDQIGINCKKNNRKIAKEMELNEFENTDLYEFMLKIKNDLESSN